jgi:hypothetical protein
MLQTDWWGIMTRPGHGLLASSKCKRLVEPCFAVLARAGGMV